MDDDEIIELLFKRSQKGLSVLSERYGAQCMSISMNLLSNRQDAEECVNDALLAIWNEIPPVHPDDLKVYLFKIVRNISIRKFRKRLAEKNRIDDSYDTEMMEGIAAKEPLPDERIEFLELKSTINSFLKTRSKLDRMIFIRRMWFFEDYETIAKRSGLRTGTVITRMHRLKKKAREFMHIEEEKAHGKKQ